MANESTEKSDAVADGGEQPTRADSARSRNIKAWHAERKLSKSHGVWSALVGSGVPDELKPAVDAFEARIVKEHGGVDAITAEQTVLIASAAVSYTVILLCKTLLLDSRVPNRRRQRFAAVLAVLAAQQNSCRRNLQQLRLGAAGAPESSFDEEMAAIAAEIRQEDPQ